jgi:hypothetical protein
MREWLPENFTPPQGLAEKIAKTAIKRGKARRRNERIALSFCSFLFVGILSFMAVQNFRDLTPLESRHSETGFTAKTNEESPVPRIRPADGVREAVPVAGRSFRSEAPEGLGRMTPSASARKPLPSEVLNFQKVDDSVEISWQGKGRYAVYKCDTPTFSACSIVKVVEGNKYLDKDENSGKIMYYRIEPLERKG